MARLTLRPCLQATAALVVVAALQLIGADPSSAQDDGLAPECLAATPKPTLTIGDVECQRMTSAHAGGTTVFSYFIPERCAPGGPASPCPVEYFFHGTAGDYESGLGPKGEPNARVAALFARPSVDPRTVADPWTHADPSTWIPAEPIDLILVSPHGLTVPGGHGPAPGVDTGWADWHPKYAAGGEFERYPTPPPRLESFVIEELVPYIDEHFPTVADRTHRALTGKSQGGFGSFAVGLSHPDVFSVLGMFSGGGFPFPALLAEGIDTPPGVSIAPPADLPYEVFPGPAGLLSPESLWSTILVSEVTVGFGDPVVDNVWWRGINPIDLLANARAFAADGTQSVYLKYHVNDAVARRIPDDFTGPGFPGNVVFETILFPADLYMEQIFDALEIERTFHVGPGLHDAPYQDPYQREHHEAYAANLATTGTALSNPRVFDYRTHRETFEVWGWRFDVKREPIEFLFLTDVTCESLTLRGTGVVTVTPPAHCGADPIVVALGPSFPFDEVLGTGTIRAWGNVRTVTLASSEAGSTGQDPAVRPHDAGQPSHPATGGGMAGFALLLGLGWERSRRRR